MKVTKQFLKSLIKEELQRINEGVSLSDIKNMDDAQLAQLLATFAKKLTNTDHSPESILNILNTIEKPPSGPIDLSPWSKPLKRDPSGRPIPQDDDSDSELAQTVAGKGQKE